MKKYVILLLAFVFVNCYTRIDLNDMRIPKNYNVIEIIKPDEKYKLMYVGQDWIIKELNESGKFKKMDDLDKKIVLDKIPLGGVIRIKKGKFDEGSEYSAEIFHSSKKISECSSDLYLETEIMNLDYGMPKKIGKGGIYPKIEQPDYTVPKTIKFKELNMECDIKIENPDTMFVHLFKNSEKIGVFRIDKK